LQITNEASGKISKQLDKEMSIVPVLATTNNKKQAIIPKSMVPDLECFDGNKTKFKDWWKGI